MLWNVKSKCVQTHKYIIAKGSDRLGVNLRFISLELCFHGQFPPMLHFYFLIYKMGIKMTLTHWNLVGWSLFLYVCFCCCLVTQSCPTLCNPMDCSPPASSVRGICQARILGSCCHSLLQWLFPTQGLNPHLLNLLHRQADSLLLGHQGSPFLHVKYFNST